MEESASVGSLGLPRLTFHIPYRKSTDAFGNHGYAVMLRLNLSEPTHGFSLVEPIQCVVDSGAARCVFHADIADTLGLNLKSGNHQQITGIGGTEDIWTHDVVLHLPGGSVKIRAGFQENLPIAGLLGMGGFFEHFNITFDSVMERCTFQRIYRA